MRKFAAAFAATLAGGAILLSASAAGAATTKQDSHAIQASPKSPFTLPAGYLLVTSAPVTALNGTQTHGYATCPGTRQPAGGGAFVESGSVGASINSSYPSGSSWAVDVNNASGADTEFTPYAVCVAHTAGYTIATASGTTGQGERDAAIDCPTGTSVIGGGAFSASSDLWINIDTSTPFGPLGNGISGWEVFMSSVPTTPTSYTVYAVCHARPRGWSIQTGSATAVLPGTQGEATVTCPGNSVPLGGGAYTQFNVSAETVNMNSSNPSTNTWRVYENNDESTTYYVTAATVCAGT